MSADKQSFFMADTLVGDAMGEGGANTVDTALVLLLPAKSRWSFARDGPFIKTDEQPEPDVRREGEKKTHFL